MGWLCDFPDRNFIYFDDAAETFEILSLQVEP
jgi:hypothetical protein